jgi:hypothetical protein
VLGRCECLLVHTLVTVVGDAVKEYIEQMLLVTMPMLDLRLPQKWFSCTYIFIYL